MKLTTVLLVASLLLGQSQATLFSQQTDSKPGYDDVVDEQRMSTGQLIAPAGVLAKFHGRPVDLEVGPDQKQLFVKDRGTLRIFSIESMEEQQAIPIPGGASLYGIEIASDGTVLVSNAKNGLCVFRPQDEQPATYELARTIPLADNSFPCGMAINEDASIAYVCLSRNNSIAVVDLKQAKLLEQIEVGVAPFDCRFVEANQLLVSNIGGRRAVEGDKTAPSAGTEVVVDKRGIASTGTLSLVDIEKKTVSSTIDTGRHPTTLGTAADNQAVVCLTNEDVIALIDVKSGRQKTINVRPKEDIPFGSMPSAILKHGDLQLVALAGNNSIAVVDPEAPKPVQGMVPTAWYPVGLAKSDTHLFVACVKGLGSRWSRREQEKGMNSHDHLGTVQKIPLAKIGDQETLKRWTAQALQQSKLQRISPAIERQLSTEDSVKPVPIPAKLGQPSVFKHVIYVIKENRTFDQVFGDVKEARSDPNLCIFPRDVTPNHHAIADRFGVLDNYYCNGVLSADGHSWATEGNVTPYLERAFGGFARSYTFGDDPITYSSSGFLWDHVLDAGLSFRNYGEMDYAEPPAGMKYQEIWIAYQAGEQIKFRQKIGIERLRKYSSRDYPGWNMVIPDVLRMDRFLKEFRQFEENGELPNLCIVYLPQDHLGGGVTSQAHMADNDLAVGRLVEAVSNSRYWKETVIFVNEDDPQNGYDHIDGHRSLCLVVSPYSRKGINHDFFNQTSVLRTILHIFGLPPMNQQDAAAPLMRSCFQEQPDLKPYQCLDANYELNATSVPKEKQTALEQRWRRILATVPIQRTGMKSEQDEDNLNRFVWHEVKGWETPYPDDWAGPHGKGLERLKLRLDPDAEEE